MVQFCYLKLYLGIETVSCHLLQRMARMEMDWNLKKLNCFFTREAHKGSRSNWNLEVLVFEESGKPEKNLLEQRREPTTNSTHRWHRRQDTNLGHIGGRRVVSPLRHPCSPKILTEKLIQPFQVVVQCVQNPPPPPPPNKKKLLWLVLPCAIYLISPS